MVREGGGLLPNCEETEKNPLETGGFPAAELTFPLRRAILFHNLSAADAGGDKKYDRPEKPGNILRSVTILHG